MPSPGRSWKSSSRGCSRPRSPNRPRFRPPAVEEYLHGCWLVDLSTMGADAWCYRRLCAAIRRLEKAMDHISRIELSTLPNTGVTEIFSKIGSNWCCGTNYLRVRQTNPSRPRMARIIVDGSGTSSPTKRQTVVVSAMSLDGPLPTSRNTLSADRSRPEPISKKFDQGLQQLPGSWLSGRHTCAG